MSDIRKCLHCTRPAAFLSALCETCRVTRLKSNKKLHDSKRREKLADPSYVKWRTNRLARLEKGYEGDVCQ